MPGMTGGAIIAPVGAKHLGGPNLATKSPAAAAAAAATAATAAAAAAEAHSLPLLTSHRPDLPGGAGAGKSVGNIVISFVGAGMLSLPFAFQQIGVLLGSVAFTLVAALCVWCMLLLIDAKYMLERDLTGATADAALSARRRAGAAARLAGAAAARAAKAGASRACREDAAGAASAAAAAAAAAACCEAALAASPPIALSTFGSVGRALWGARGQWVVDVPLMVSQCGFCVGYVVVG